MHVLLLAPQNPFYVLQAAETAYTVGDLALSIKMFLMVVDMTDGDDSESLVESTPLGITVRAWYGVKLVGIMTYYLRTKKAMLTSCSVRDASRRTRGWQQIPPPILPLRKMSRCSTSSPRSVYGSRTRALGKRERLQRGERRCLLGLLPLDPIFGRKLTTERRQITNNASTANLLILRMLLPAVMVGGGRMWIEASHTYHFGATSNQIPLVG